VKIPRPEGDGTSGDPSSAYFRKFMYAELAVEVPADGLSLPQYWYAFFCKYALALRQSDTQPDQVSGAEDWLPIANDQRVAHARIVKRNWAELKT